MTCFFLMSRNWGKRFILILLEKAPIPKNRKKYISLTEAI